MALGIKRKQYDTIAFSHKAYILVGNMKILYLNTNSMISTFRKNSERRRRKSTLFLSKSNSNIYASSFLFYSFNCVYSWETRHQSQSPEDMGNEDVCLASRSSQRLQASHGTLGEEASVTTLPNVPGRHTLCCGREGQHGASLDPVVGTTRAQLLEPFQTPLRADLPLSAFHLNVYPFTIIEP